VINIKEILLSKQKSKGKNINWIGKIVAAKNDPSLILKEW